MFRRPESLRERTLLRLIDRQAKTIADLNDRLMEMSGYRWNVPAAEVHREPVEAVERDWLENPAEAPLY